jgi:hypothetical protein
MDGSGMIIMSQDEDVSRMLLSSENPAMALYEGNGYRFFPYTVEGKQDIDDIVSDDIHVYKIKLIFTNANAYTLLASEENADMKIGVNMIFTKANGRSDDITYNFNQTILEQLTKDNALILKVSGIKKLGTGTLDAAGVIRSTCLGVERHFDMPEMA